jgi:nitroreductase
MNKTPRKPLPLASSLTQRYGGQSPQIASLPVNAVIESILDHRSVRGYLPDKLSPGTLETLIAAGQSAPTSSNLQTWTAIAVEGAERKARLSVLAGDQAHIRECPSFLVFIADLSRLDRIAQARSEVTEGNRYLEMFLMAAIDAALAAQNIVVAAESMGLGTVYIGAMRNRPEEVAAELALPPDSFAVFGLCVGHPDPARLSGIRPRLAQSTILHREQYDGTAEAAAITDYDRAMGEFQVQQGMKAIDWTRQTIKRVGTPEALMGRHRLVEALKNLGFGLK